MFGLTAAALNLPSFILEGQTGIFQTQNDINFLDRTLLYSYNQKLDDVSTISSYASLLLPGISVLGHIKDLNIYIIYGVMYCEAFLFTMGTKDLIKLIIPRNRPYTYLGDIPPGEEDDYYNSFPSGHTAFAFIEATFLATTFSHEYPSSKLKFPVIALSYALAAGTGIMRITSGTHFLTDVAAGAVIGSFYGWFIPAMHIRNKTDSALLISYGLNSITLLLLY